MTKDSHHIGQQGEKIAQAILRQKGFRIDAVNWRSGKLGEIDLIAFHPEHELLAFVEVKTRKSTLYGAPVEAVDQRKQAQLNALAEAYLTQHPQENHVQVRFDVISIFYPGPSRPADITHLENAF